MRLFDTNIRSSVYPIARMWIFALSALAILSSRSSASKIGAYPDSVNFTTHVGVYTSSTVIVSDGRDSNQFPHAPLTAAIMWITGSSDYSLGSDSVLSFFGQTYVVVAYTASSLSPSSAVLHIQ